jgi:hypothetical protein
MCAERAMPGRLAAALLILAVASATPAQQDEHIFEPGKKHVCVPAASGQGWDCSSTETPPTPSETRREPRLRSSSEIPHEPQPEPTASAAPTATATPASTPSAATTTPAPEPAAAPPPVSLAAPVPAAAPPRSSAAGNSGAAGSSRSRNVPSYLLAPGASDSRPAAQPVAASPPAPAVQKSEPTPVRSEPARSAATVQAETPRAPAETARTPAQPAPSQAAAQTPAAAETPRAPAESPRPVATTPPPRSAPEPQPASAAPPQPKPVASPQIAPVASTADTPPAAVAAPASTPAAAQPQRSEPATQPARAATILRDSNDFRRLADTRYVLELASGSDRRSVEDTASQAALPHGSVWLLTLRRDGAPWHLAVWGDFDSVDAARAARNEAQAAGMTAGWPRRAGPLKQELRGEP